MKKKRSSELLSVLVIVAIVGYVCFQVIRALSVDYKTEIATVYSVSDEIESVGIAVRDEIVVETSETGVFDYRISDGEKIAKGAVIAYVYDSAQSAKEHHLLESLQQMCATLVQLSNSSVSTTEFSLVRDNLYEALSQLALCAGNDRLPELSAACTDALRELSSVYIYTDNDSDFTERIAALTQRIEELSAAVVPATSSIYAPQTGYFITHTDGFETLINKDAALDISVGDMVSLLETLPVTTNQFKLVSDYEWYYAAIIDSQYADRFSEGVRVDLDFNYAGVTDLLATVERIVTDESLNRTLVIFSCDYFNSSTASLRLDNATIRFSEYSGIRLPRAALRYEDGVMGVYIKYGDVVRFRVVEPIYETDEYVICSDSSTTSNALELYDEIITEGSDLYVGKELN